MSVGEDLGNELQIWHESGDLAIYANALGAMFAEAESLCADTDTVVGWQPIWDVDLCPANGLPWLAQIVGERLVQGLPEAAGREQIRKTPNAYRGTLASIVDALKVELIGAKRVYAKERFNGSVEDEDALSVIVRKDEVTVPQKQLEDRLRTVVPGDIDVVLQIISSVTWADLEAGGPTWKELVEKYGKTWAEIEASGGGYTVYE